jgi:hypothetical protein
MPAALRARRDFLGDTAWHALWAVHGARKFSIVDPLTSTFEQGPTLMIG